MRISAILSEQPAHASHVRSRDGPFKMRMKARGRQKAPKSSLSSHNTCNASDGRPVLNEQTACSRLRHSCVDFLLTYCVLVGSFGRKHTER